MGTGQDYICCRDGLCPFASGPGTRGDARSSRDPICKGQEKKGFSMSMDKMLDLTVRKAYVRWHNQMHVALHSSHSH